MAYCLTTDWWHQPHCLLGQSNQETTISFLIVLSSATFGQKTPLLLDPSQMLHWITSLIWPIGGKRSQITNLKNFLSRSQWYNILHYVENLKGER
jgi:hypothetical protein